MCASIVKMTTSVIEKPAILPEASKDESNGD
jgi:hypothetical protein